MSNLGNLVIGITATTKGLQAASRKTQSILSGLGRTATSLPAILTGAGVAGGALGLARVADEYAVLGAQLEYVTGSAKEAEKIQERLYTVSKKTGTQVTDNANSFVKLTQAQKLTKLTTEQNLQAIETINSLMIKTGTSGAQASAAMLQLSQALTSGKLAGDEFRSLAENAPGFLNALAEAMGMPREELKQLAKEGEITSERMGQAFIKLAEDGQSMATDLPGTFARGWNQVVLALERAWDKVNDENGFIGLWMDATTRLTEHIETNTDAIVEWFERGFKSILDNKDNIVFAIEAIGNAIKFVYDWTMKAIEGYRSLMASFNASQEVLQERNNLSNQQAFIDNIVKEEGLEDEYNAIENTSRASIVNNFNQNVSRSDVEAITNQQLALGARL